MYVSFKNQKLVQEAADYLRFKQVSHTECWVLLVIAKYCSDDEQIGWPALETIAGDGLMSVSTVQRAIKSLIKAEVLKVVGMMPHRNLIYKLMITPAMITTRQWDWDDVDIEPSDEGDPDKSAGQIDHFDPVIVTGRSGHHDRLKRSSGPVEVFNLTYELEKESPQETEKEQQHSTTPTGEGEVGRGREYGQETKPLILGRTEKTTAKAKTSPATPPPAPQGSKVVPARPQAPTTTRRTEIPVHKASGRLSAIYYNSLGRRPSLLDAAANRWPRLFTSLIRNHPDAYTEEKIAPALEWGFTDDKYWAGALDRYTGDSVEWFCTPENVDKLLSAYARRKRQSTTHEATTSTTIASPAKEQPVWMNHLIDPSRRSNV